MEIHGTVWEILKAPKPDPGAIAEALRTFRSVLADYARGKGLSAVEVEEAVRRSLATLIDPSFISTVDPEKVRFRPLLHALVTQAIGARGWSSISEKAEPAILEVTSGADEEFDRLWRLHLVRRATQDLSGDAPVQERALPPGEFPSAEGRLKALLGRSVRAYAVTDDQYASEVRALIRASGAGGMDDLARRLFSGLIEEGGPGRPPLRIARVRVGVAGIAGIVFVAAVVVAWTSCELRMEREARVREREDSRLVHEAERAIERAAAFAFEGGDVSRHHEELRRAVEALQRLRPASPLIGRGLSLEVGAALDPALYKEASAAAGALPEGAVLAWDHWVYRTIRQAVWAEPAGGHRPAEGRGRRVEADLWLLAGEDERALDLYMELQLVRPGDPLVWLGGALAAWRGGSPSTGARFARRAAELLDLGEGRPREGHALARALEGFCFENLGREEERIAAFQAAARRAGGSPFARALPSRPPQGPGAPAPRLPRGSARVLLFEASGEPAPAALESALEGVRQRLQAVGLLPGGEVKWDADSRRMLVSLAESTPESVQAAEWLVVRRGVFGARDLAPRSLNDQWRHPSKPAGHEWAPINLFYPDLPRVAGRYRLLSREIPLLAREELTVRYDAAQGRLFWSSRDPGALPAGAGLALLLDGEIFWYGRVGDSRSGFLVVGPSDPQTMIPVIFRHGPIPVQFVRRG
jgi:hypothetical protein